MDWKVNKAAGVEWERGPPLSSLLSAWAEPRGDMAHSFMYLCSLVSGRPCSIM